MSTPASPAQLAPGQFILEARDGRARTGKLYTAHGAFQTPAFMPIGTQGTVKGMDPERLVEIGAEIILTNTYHLHLRPGDELIRDLGGIHRFMAWDGPILSDSGGFQVFSLSKLRKVTERGVTFQSHIDGATVEFTPEKVISIQENLGVDIMMVLDECMEHSADRAYAEVSLARTLRWAEQALEARTRRESLLFGIVQGGAFEELRLCAIEELIKLPFDGYAIGGVSVGEPTEQVQRVTDICAANLPETKVRYLMGVGTPSDIVSAVLLGVDMFDCVIPTRSARFGRLFTQNSFINIRNSVFRSDTGPIDEGCDCYTCRKFTRAYLSHLMHSKEVLFVELATLHNLRFYQRLMHEIRVAIRAGRFSSFAAEYLQRREEMVLEENVTESM